MKSEGNTLELIKRMLGIEAAKQDDRPMSKLKKDLLEQFHVVDEKGFTRFQKLAPKWETAKSSQYEIMPL